MITTPNISPAVTGGINLVFMEDMQRGNTPRPAGISEGGACNGDHNDTAGTMNKQQQQYSKEM
jgi:hypothetical protein